MTKRFELTLRRLNNEDTQVTVASFDRIEADDMVQLMVQLTVIVAKIMRDWHEEEALRTKLEMMDEQIPF